MKQEQWARLKESADKELSDNPDSAALFEARAMAHRNLGELDAAVSDYGKAIDLDPHNEEAWMMRGACKMQRAASEQNREKALEMMNDAHGDYRRAAELSPQSEMTGLALLEMEICIGKYLDAVGTTGEWWDRIQNPTLKLVCAWLGAIAMILAGRPERRWAHLRDHLKADRRPLHPMEWCIVEIEQYIKLLEKQPGLELSKVKEVHDLFVSHFNQAKA